MRPFFAALFLVLAALLAAPSTGLAVEPDEVLADPVLEARAREISAGLRCLVCQNQSIDDSNAELAKDLRVLVRERLLAGDTNAEVIDYVVSRYGEFVLLKPRLSAKTVLLWAAPALVLLLGLAGIVALFRRRPPPAAAAPLSAEEEKRLRQVLEARDAAQ